VTTQRRRIAFRPTITMTMTRTMPIAMLPKYHMGPTVSGLGELGCRNDVGNNSGMADGRSGTARRPNTRRGRWNSFVASGTGSARVRALAEPGNPTHRVRVEFDGHTLLLHLSDEDGHGWTTVAVDRASRIWAVAQRETQLEAAASACTALYET
jgi:hypothetical protein